PIYTLAGFRAFSQGIVTQWNRTRTYRGFFFRAEDYFGFVKRLRTIDQELKGDIVDFEKNLSGHGLKVAVGAIHGQKDALQRKYGDLTQVSHGEGFLKVLESRIQPEGIYLIDEPEAALSPQRQLALFSLIKNLAVNQNCQFIIATHSPILMSLPDSQILQFDEQVHPVSVEETEHFMIMKNFLTYPEGFPRFLWVTKILPVIGDESDHVASGITFSLPKGSTRGSSSQKKLLVLVEVCR